MKNVKLIVTNSNGKIEMFFFFNNLVAQQVADELEKRENVKTTIKE